uniref:Retinol dehydrogenase 13 n=2 Tax=Octopus bimaculoides TaxID=37653 RepID=A0A0L8GQG5_OCTBM
MARRLQRSLNKFFYPLSFIGTIAGASVLLKDYLGGSKYEGKEKIAGKTVVITGANSGIGKAVATGLAYKRGRIILACRDMERCAEAQKEIIHQTANLNIHCRKLDLASIKSIKAFADAFNKTENRLDILINNAGVMCSPKSLTEDGFEQQLGVNYLGHFLLTVLLLDKLKKSAPSRILNICSHSFKNGSMNWQDLNSAQKYDNREAFYQSHLAKVLFTTELSRRLQGSGVTVNAVYPGVTNTNLGNHLGINKSYISSILLWPIKWILLKTPMQGAQTALFCSVDPSLETVSGHYFCNNKEMEFPTNALDTEAATRLWLISEKWMGIKQD